MFISRSIQAIMELKKFLPEITRRFRIPVRVQIHSSLVSTSFVRSSLDTFKLGTTEPHRTSLQPLLTNLKTLVVKISMGERNFHALFFC